MFDKLFGKKPNEMEIVMEFREKTDRYQKNHPLDQVIEQLLQKEYSEAFS